MASVRRPKGVGAGSPFQNPPLANNRPNHNHHNDRNTPKRVSQQSAHSHAQLY